MKLTLSWLKGHLDTSASRAEIVQTLTRMCVVVEHPREPEGPLS